MEGELRHPPRLNEPANAAQRLIEWRTVLELAIQMRIGIPDASIINFNLDHALMALDKQHPHFQHLRLQYEINESPSGVASDDVEAVFAYISKVLTWLNMLTIIAVIELLGFPILDSTLLEERFVLAFLFAWSLHLYMHLYRGERYKQIVREFEDEDAASHRRGTVAVLCYSVFSPVACFGLGMVVASMRS